MCGIFGVVTNQQPAWSASELRAAARDLMRRSESRGKEASGLALMNAETIRVLKQATPGAALFRLRSCRELFENSFGGNGSVAHGVAVIGHTRLVTDGGLERHENNQPVISGGIVGIHNGIIVNVGGLWNKYPDLQRRLEVDTEVILALFRRTLDAGDTIPQALERVFSEVYGVANIALLLKERNQIVLATNNGSLYFARGDGVFVFASERQILSSFLKGKNRRGQFDGASVEHLAPGMACVVDAATVDAEVFKLGETPPRVAAMSRNGYNREIIELSQAETQPRNQTRLVDVRRTATPEWVEQHWDQNRAAIGKLRRCTRCILPETVPFVDFDENGVCWDCRNNSPYTWKGMDALQRAIEPYRRGNGAPEVLMPLSGGRDSCYTLHFVKKELGLQPVAFTYDWGMVTGLARRNQSRLCSKLGVEHIWVSANINSKRENIRKNVSAWLRKPDMGVIPLFMAGDKQIFHYAEKIAKQIPVDLTLYSMNRLEYTDFKSGYCGIGRGIRADQQGSFASLKMISHYLRAFATNRGYLNASLADTAWAFAIYYMSPVHRRYLIFEDYVPWDEDAIISTLRNEYDWELSPDTTTTWRIGDGTAPFYNYIYYTVGGFTEIDTFRSNQVRAGMLDRASALRLATAENELRFDSIKWYCDTIGIDTLDALRAINAIPKRYTPA